MKQGADYFKDGWNYLDMTHIAIAQGNKAIFDSTDVKNSSKHTIILNYGEVTDITPDIRLTLHNAGHILGSAMCHFNIGDGFHNLLYSGKIKKFLETYNIFSNVRVNLINIFIQEFTMILSFNHINIGLDTTVSVYDIQTRSCLMSYSEGAHIQ